MGLTDRMVLGAFYPRFVAVLLSALGVYIAVELVDIAAQQSGSTALLRYPLRLPLALVMVSPIVFLLSGCWTGVHLVRTGQLLAISAAGRGPHRALLSLIIVGVIWSGLVWGVSDFISPLALREWSDTDVSRPRWVLGGDGLLLRDGEREGEVLSFRLDERGLPEARIEAKRVVRESDRWVLEDTRTIRPEEGSERHKRLEVKVARFDPMLGEHPQQLSGSELSRSLATSRERGIDSAPYEAESGLRIALSIACLICTVFGAVFGLIFGKRPSIASASVVGIGLLYWLIIAPCWALAMTGAMSGDALAIVPTVVLGGPALLLYLIGLR